MAVIAWVVVRLVVGPGMTLVFIAAMLAGLMLALLVSRGLLLRGHHARPLYPREWPDGHALLRSLAVRRAAACARTSVCAQPDSQCLCHGPTGEQRDLRVRRADPAPDAARDDRGAGA
jgi:hypothetical protein